MAGALPPDWKIVPFREIADYRLGRTPPRNSGRFWSASSAAFPWVSIADLRPFGTVNRTTESVTADAYEEIFQRQLAPAGTLLMSFKLTIGRTSVLDIDAFHNEAIISIFPRVSVDRDFLKFYLPTINFADHQDRAVKGQTLNRGKIDRLPVVLPPLDEQRVIAHTLETIRLRVEKEAAICDKLAALKSATMAKLFREGLRGEPLKQTEIGEIPESWEVVSIGNLSRVKGGKRMPKGVALQAADSGRPYIRVADFDNHTVKLDGLMYVPCGYEEVIARYRVDAGDVYISIAGTIGEVGQIPEALQGANLTENAAKLVFTGNTVLPRYVMYALASPSGRDQIARLTTKNAQPKLALARIEQIRLPRPPTLEEQQELVAILDTINGDFLVHRQKSRSLEKLFRMMLHRLMTGAIRVKDLDLAEVSHA